MDVRSYEAGQYKKLNNKRDNECGGIHKESPGKQVEVVWACDEKRGTLRRKEGDGNESTWEKVVGQNSDDIKEKGLSADEVYGHSTRRGMSSYIDPT